ncbi:threonylcarbamoyl-AMP synthase [Patescibacteria group bacterium]|nr:threonylcarbamoyl-AMP synthase [Patescibacteria group bacterium]
MEIIRLTDANLTEAAQKASMVLMRGGIVLYPTDTLYGLAVSALNVKAVERLKDLKGREKKKPLSVAVKDIETMQKYGKLNERAQSIARAHLPGPLTLVVPATDAIPKDILLNGNIGIRIPNDPFCLALANAFQLPYTATSANRAGRETPATPHEVIVQFASLAHNIDLVIDDGPRAGGTPSTVLLCAGDSVHILRHGALSKEDLGL